MFKIQLSRKKVGLHYSGQHVTVTKKLLECLSKRVHVILIFLKIAQKKREVTKNKMPLENLRMPRRLESTLHSIGPVIKASTKLFGFS